MAKAKLRRMLFLGALTGLTVTLMACEPEDHGQVKSSSLLSEAALGPGWSMADLAGVEPALLGGNYSEMPQALPMQTSWDGGYDYALPYDYAPETEGYYEPLDESYYQESSGADEYLWLTLAAALGGMLGDSPPDYAFGYEGIQPWAWETGDHYVRYAEPVYGGYRYYYYEPDTFRPFLVRDPHYSYGFRDDRLMVIYDRHGRILDGGRARHQRLAAREYYLRGEHLYQAGHKHQRFGVAAQLWDDRREKIRHERREWEEARRDHEDWKRSDVRHQQRLRRDWAGEALVRRNAEREFANWQKTGYRMPAPEFYTAESRAKQLRKVAEIRRVQANEPRKERAALVQRRDHDRALERAQDHDRSRQQWARLERRGDDQVERNFQRASLAPEWERSRTDRAERLKDRGPRLHPDADRRGRTERAAERQQKEAAQHQERQRWAENGSQNVQRQQRAALVQKGRASELRNQARETERLRKQQQAQRAEHRREAARSAEARLNRKSQQRAREAHLPEQAKQKGVHRAREERQSKAQTRAISERRAGQELRQRQRAQGEEMQRTQRRAQQHEQARQAPQGRSEADRQQERHAERQARHQKTSAQREQQVRVHARHAELAARQERRGGKGREE